MQQKNIGDLNCYVIEPDLVERPAGVVVLMHGYGADGRDLISIADMWRERLRNVIYIAPDAPHQCEDSPFGLQWFSLNPYTQEAMLEGVRQTDNMMETFIQGVIKKYGVKKSQIVMGGFSQGCMMAIYTALKSKAPYAGVLGYSGRLVDEDAAKNCPNKTTQIHLIHGTQDTVVPSGEWDDAMEILKKLNYSVTGYKTKGLGHSIDYEGIESGFYFINNCLS